MRKNGKTAFLLCNILIPLMIGAAIYVLLSPDVIFIKKIEELIPVCFHIKELNSGSILITVLRNYASDGLWGYALVFALFFILGNNAAEVRKILVLAAVFSAVIEFLQLMPVAGGTFDVLDIVVEILAESAAAFIIKRVWKT